jgi:hypothetical protein
MEYKGPAPRVLGVQLISILLVSCATNAPAPTLTQRPPTLAPTTIPGTPTFTTIPATPTRTPLPLPISPEFPTGSFFHQHADGTYCVFEFNEDGTYAFYWLALSVDVSGREPYLVGTYTVDGYLLTDTTTDISGSCPPAPYTWTYDGKTLAFQAVGEDPCSDRQRTYESPLLYTMVE